MATDDKATAAKIVSGLQPAHRLTAKNRKLWNIEGKQRFTDRRCVTRQIHELESAIVAALEAARREAGAATQRTIDAAFREGYEAALRVHADTLNAKAAMEGGTREG
jgi:hypothetical protein